MKIMTKIIFQNSKTSNKWPEISVFDHNSKTNCSKSCKKFYLCFQIRMNLTTHCEGSVLFAVVWYKTT